jgi:hypothetical protein
MAPPSPAGKAVAPRTSLTGSASTQPMSTMTPNMLLDALDTSRARAGVAGSNMSSSSAPAFDPIDFLNKNYTTETTLVAQLPSLRDAVSTRMQRLDDRISNALQRQSETADATRRNVQVGTVVRSGQDTWQDGYGKYAGCRTLSHTGIHSLFIADLLIQSFRMPGRPCWR